MDTERRDNHTWRKFKSALASDNLPSFRRVLVIAPLGLVFFHLLVNGAGSVNWDFFTKLPAPVGAVGGGMANAIVGTLELLALAARHRHPDRRVWAEFISPNTARLRINSCPAFSR